MKYKNMKRRKTKKVKMVRILGETVRKGGKKYRILLDERRRFLRRQRDPNSSYYGVPISELLKSNRRRTKRCWKGYSPVKGMRPYSKGSCRRIRRNEEYARQIPRRDRPMRGRGFDKKFDVSAGSDYRDLEKLLLESRNKENKKIGANTYVIRYGDGSIGVVLYQTRILRYYPNGDVDVNFGGYMTPTTFSRINSLIPYGWNLRKKAGKLALENSWGQRAVIRKPRAGEEYAVRLTSDKAYLID